MSCLGLVVLVASCHEAYVLCGRSMYNLYQLYDVITALETRIFYKTFELNLNSLILTRKFRKR